ncbi:MAG: sulfite exporter TauE/SafE family protein, partial [Actinomycetota bacterium]|nr:sulfite exporter TauE/SafE family protein [Actinomycetota bacterium]
MRALIASPLGLLVGLSLGALGGGGSILAVPALAHGVGESAQMATTTSLLVVGISSLIGVVPHWRKHNVDVRAGLLFALAGVGGSYVGTSLNRGVDGDVLMLAFAGFMVLA